tara:strand:- start:410 stop:889 length:480 start_codon:yes stop_codon:yes gene_type:complete
MKSLFENWRYYINESQQFELGDSDNEKLLAIFWGSGVQAKQLAEMTGNMDMLRIFDEILEAVKTYISRLDGYISGEIPFDDAPYLIANSIEDHAIEIVNQVADLYDVSLEGAPFDNWIDTLIEAGDYVWYHGTPNPGANVASEKSSKSDYEELKRWAGA